LSPGPAIAAGLARDHILPGRDQRSRLQQRPGRNGVRLQLDMAQPVAKVEDVRQFLEFIVRQLVEFPDEVMLSEIPNGRLTVFRLQMRQTDVGRIIGRNGQTIRAIRALLSSAAARHGQKATLDIVE